MKHTLMLDEEVERILFKVCAQVYPTSADLPVEEQLELAIDALANSYDAGQSPEWEHEGVSVPIVETGEPNMAQNVSLEQIAAEVDRRTRLDISMPFEVTEPQSVVEEPARLNKFLTFDEVLISHANIPVVKEARDTDNATLKTAVETVFRVLDADLWDTRHGEDLVRRTAAMLTKRKA